MAVRPCGEVEAARPQASCQTWLDPLIQVEAVVEKEAEGQETSRVRVIPADGAEVQIIKDEQKKQQAPEGDRITSALGAG